MERYHPIVNFIFFCVVIGFGMVLLHPVCVVISLLGAGMYTMVLLQRKKAQKTFFGLFGIMVLTAVVNPAFSHQGVTALMELPTGNVLTLESIYYGLGAAGMLAVVLLWFRCMSVILTSEKIVYLFGKGFPVLGLLLSMILGFVPKMLHKWNEIRNAYVEDDQEKIRTLLKWKQGMERLSILITWSFEDAAQTADSMKSRGYGLLGRTAFTTYRFMKRDIRACMYLLGCVIYMGIGYWKGALYFEYYPQVEMAEWSVYTGSVYVVYLILVLTPTIMKWREEHRWKQLQSEI